MIQSAIRAHKMRQLTYADVCCCMLTYACLRHASAANTVGDPRAEDAPARENETH
jgi:hypothetical protein